MDGVYVGTATDPVFIPRKEVYKLITPVLCHLDKTELVMIQHQAHNQLVDTVERERKILFPESA